ncbi:MAG: hypothetical protein RBS37_00935 [Bacteroidales bacterium]|nr:hypothetical protein [Bacteroidales bacterium]
MKKTGISLIIPVLLLAVAGLVSCKERKSAEQQKIEIDQRGEIEKQIEENVYPLPTSAEVIKLLTDLDVGYIIGISNPVENASGYVTSRSRAANLGVYGADLSYATLYNIQQEVTKYLGAIRTLANELNMSKIYDEKLYTDIKENFDNRDELVSILTVAFNNTYYYLNENDQQSLAILMIGGAWLEGMYITTNISESVYHVEGIVRVLLEQKESFELFLKIAEPYAEDPMVKEFLELVGPVKNVYTGLSSSLSEADVAAITKVVAEARDKLVI